MSETFFRLRHILLSLIARSPILALLDTKYKLETDLTNAQSQIYKLTQTVQQQREFVRRSSEEANKVTFQQSS